MLSEDLKSRYRIDETTAAHIDDVYELITTYDTSILGWSPTSREDVRADLELERDVIRHHVLRHDGAMVQSWLALREPGSPYIDGRVITHPDLDAADADRLFAIAWDVINRWARQLEGAPTQDLILFTGTFPEDDADARRAEAEGFRHERTFWDMAGPVEDAARPDPVPDLAIVKADPHVLHEIVQAAFVDHWAFVHQSFEDFMEAERTWPGYDPDQWWIAELAGDPAAMMTLNRRFDEEGILYVQILGTLKKFRRRGIGSALLRHAFDVAAAAGYDSISLHVDSASTTGAPAVYRRAGLQVRHAWNAYVKELEG